jgi:hypothetical protein
VVRLAEAAQTSLDTGSAHIEIRENEQLRVRA